MVDTIKFSEFADGGDLANDETTVGLGGGTNRRYNNPWTFLPPGTTAERPTPSAQINYRLRFNTDVQLYEYYDAILAAWTQLQESGFTQGPFVIYKADSGFPDAFDLGSLASGILKQNVALGVSTPLIAVNGIDYYGPGFTGYIESPAGINDVSANHVLGFTSAGALSVNYLNIVNALTGTAPIFQAIGSDPDISIAITPKGAASTNFRSTSNIPVSFLSGTGYQHITAFNFANTSATRNVTFQDASGTLAYLTDIPAGSPSPLTKTDDTNVTLTLGGTPATALLQAVSLTLGWTGTLAETRGGTGQSTYALGDTLYSSAANTLSKLAGNITTAKLYLSQTGTGAVSAPPIWSTIAGADITGAALTKTDDTNVTLTLGGTPATALLRAASLTLGWSGLLAIARGGTGVGSVTTAPTATAFAGWDANSNLSANSLIPGFATTATSGGNTVLTVASKQVQEFTGTLTQTVTLPVASSLVAGQQYVIINNSSANVTVNSSGGNAIQVMAANTTVYLDLVLASGTTAASWNSGYVFDNGAGVLSITGTANQVIASASTGAVTLSLPQSIATSSSPTFAGLTLTNPHIAGAGGLVSFQVFTSGTAATYTRPAGITSIYVEVVGGGGGGGGSTGGGASVSCGASGGAGGYASLWVPSAASSYTYTVGAAGTAGTSGGGTGGTGGTTTFSASSLQATGGVGGNGMGAITTVARAIGGAGGVGTNGTINTAGEAGGSSFAVGGGVIGGNGGSSHYGGGGNQPNLGAGAAGGNYGSGGSGGASTTVSAAGGAGSAGLIVVWEFC
jgi:hypothetical protein